MQVPRSVEAKPRVKPFSNGGSRIGQSRLTEVKRSPEEQSLNE
ncbi:hypothetical protein RSSM_04903 [Rhodopirellula sallentina SM41]|uniref:Uncharacterized protein n=1 Tax=Rhodopirellula sallentina SM41 TaxID=1263870 RepID=M5TWS3_9BACT|nr:hypothetical protein RSSM_04903 [Rhodopirellula sallentina SM41]